MVNLSRSESIKSFNGQFIGFAAEADRSETPRSRRAQPSGFDLAFSPGKRMNRRAIYLDAGLPEGEVAFMQRQGRSPHFQAAFVGIIADCFRPVPPRRRRLRVLRAAVYPQLARAAQ